MKRWMKSAALWLAVCALAGCATVPAEKKAAGAVTRDYEVADSKGAAYGIPTPGWLAAVVQDDRRALEADYPGKYIVTFQESGADLEGVQMWAETFSVNKEIAARLETHVRTKAGQGAQGNREGFDEFAREFAAVLSEASFSGVAKEGDWWVKKVFSDGRVLFQYDLFYTVDKALFDAQLADMMAGTAERDLREDVTAYMDDAADGLFR